VKGIQRIRKKRRQGRREEEGQKGLKEHVLSLENKTDRQRLALNNYEKR